MAYPNGLIRVITYKFKLFKQPYKVGEIVVVEQKSILILGIQRFHYDVRGKFLHVRYVAQVLGETYEKTKNTPPVNNWIPSWFVYSHKKLEENTHETKKCPLQLGDLIWAEKFGVTMKVVDITGLEFVGTDLKVWAMLQPIQPIPLDKAKSLYREEQKKKFEVIEFDCRE